MDACAPLRTLTRVVRRHAHRQALVGALVEAVWVGAHGLTYPLGLVTGAGGNLVTGYRFEHLPPMQRGLHVANIEAAGTPILLVHGLVDNRSIFGLLRRGLARRGFGSIFAMNYSPLTTDVRAAAALLGEQVEAIIEATGYERIHVVGHSMGGLIARYYVTRLGGDERVHTLVTLGTPHAGSVLAYALPTPLLRQLRPGSALLRELEQPAPGCRTRFIAYWSDLDQLVIPSENAALHHPDLQVRNVALRGVGHASLPILGSVVHEISTALAHLDHDGTTVTPAVTPLAPAAAARAARSSSAGATLPA